MKEHLEKGEPIPKSNKLFIGTCRVFAMLIEMMNAVRSQTVSNIYKGALRSFVYLFNDACSSLSAIYTDDRQELLLQGFRVLRLVTYEQR